MPKKDEGESIGDKIEKGAALGIIKGVQRVRNWLLFRAGNRILSKVAPGIAKKYAFGARTLGAEGEKEDPWALKMVRDVFPVLPDNEGRIGEIRETEQKMFYSNFVKLSVERIYKDMGPFIDEHKIDEEMLLFRQGNTKYDNVSVPEGYKESRFGRGCYDKIIGKVKVRNEQGKLEEKPLTVAQPIPYVLIHDYPEKRIEVLSCFGFDRKGKIQGEYDAKLTDVETAREEKGRYTEDEREKHAGEIETEHDILLSVIETEKEAVETITKLEQEHEEALSLRIDRFTDISEKIIKIKNDQPEKVLFKHTYRIVIPEKYKHVAWLRGGERLDEYQEGALPIACGCVLRTKGKKHFEFNKDELRQNQYKEYSKLDGWFIEGWIKGGKEVEDSPDKYEEGLIPIVEVEKIPLPVFGADPEVEKKVIEDATQVEGGKYKLLNELGPGIDEYGWPLEVGTDGKLKGVILKDHWEKKYEEKVWNMRNVIGEGGKEVRKIKHLYDEWTKDEDPLEIITWINNEWDTYRDDYRDGRYHKWARTSYDYHLYFNEHPYFNIGKDDKNVEPYVRVGTNGEVTSKEKGLIKRGILNMALGTLKLGTLPLKISKSKKLHTKMQEIAEKKIASRKMTLLHKKYRDGDENKIVDHYWGILALNKLERVKEKDKEKKAWRRKPSDRSPAFDLKALNKSWVHLGRKYYHADPEGQMLHLYSEEELKGKFHEPWLGKFNIYHEPHISTRGIAKFIIDFIIHHTETYEEARSIFKEHKIELDYGPRDVGGEFCTNPFAD